MQWQTGFVAQDDLQITAILAAQFQALVSSGNLYLLDHCATGRRKSGMALHAS
jgi:hypothetical protein